MMIKALVLFTALAVTTVVPAAKPKEATVVSPKEETVTITKSLAEKIVQSANEQQREIEKLRYTIYVYQMRLEEARTKMCA